MSTLAKIQEEVSNELNLKVKELTNKLNNSLVDLEIITEKVEKIIIMKD